MREYIEGTNGEVVLCFLPPRTPQHNPIEMLWRELKRAISDTFFGGSDEMKERITLLVESGEVPRIKLLWYMLEAIGVTGGTRTAALPGSGAAPEPRSRGPSPYGNMFAESCGAAEPRSCGLLGTAFHRLQMQRMPAPAALRSVAASSNPRCFRFKPDPNGGTACCVWPQRRPPRTAVEKFTAKDVDYGRNMMEI